MPAYLFSELHNIICENKIEQTPNIIINYLLIDSRKLINAEHSIFFALKTVSNDGHKYIEQLYNKGVRCFCVSQLPKILHKDAKFIVCKSPIESLQKIARYHRQKFNLKTIAITGSNGKTVVKEWLWQLLNKDFNIVRSPKSYNSQIGAPLSVWNISDNHNLAIFEAGISFPHEMELLEKIINPEIGIFTNIGTAHGVNFSSLKAKIKEKLNLFVNAKIIIYCSDNKQLKNEIELFAKQKKVKLFEWGLSENVDLQIISKKNIGTSTLIAAKYKNNTYECIIPFYDNASIENSIHCWALLLNFNYNHSEIAYRLNLLHGVEMRLELKEGINDCTIISDIYNSDVDSLEIAVDFLRQQQKNGSKILILSDIYQADITDEQLAAKIVSILKQKEVDKTICIGDKLAKNKDFFSKDTLFYPNIDVFIKKYNFSKFNNDVILLKAARSFKFEKLSALLEQKKHETVLEINLNALINNFNFFKSKINSSTKVMAMVKAFSYGAGSVEIANTLQYHNVDYLAVAYIDEGVELRKAGIYTPIMVANPENSGMQLMIKYDLEPEIFSFNSLQTFIEAIANHKDEIGKIQYPVHIKLDTGMHRLGFDFNDIEMLASILNANKNIKVKSAFSHLAASDNADFDDFTLKQINIYTKMTEELEKVLGYKFIKHIANSAAISRFKKAEFDMVRLGISLYGISACNDIQKLIEPVSSLKTVISQIKTVDKGETIGYNRAYKLTRKSKIAVIPIGYADGLNRLLSNGKGKVIVNNKKAKIVGNISMDMTTIDITNINAKEGDEVIIFGKDIQIADIAKLTNTIPYEALTNISRRVKRVYFLT